VPTLLEFAIFACITLAILVRITANRKMVDAYRDRYNRFPDWRWMWTPVDDPAIEKLRRQALLGPVFAIAGLVLLLYVLVGPPAT
jgi:hypothetical protein